MFRFIHSSDLHLGKRFGNFSGDLPSRLREARHAVLGRLARHARENGAETILLAGDTFDVETPAPDVRRQALAEMRAHAPLRWVVLPGNHDSLQATELWATLASEAPENVLLATETRPIAFAEGVFLLPAPCTTRRPGRDLTDWMDTATTPDGAIRIGLAHGPIRNFSEDSAAADVIAPDRARRAHLDYLALGDWHGALQVDARTRYCGAPEPDRFKHDRAGEALLVAIDAPSATPEVSPFVTQAFAWRSFALHLLDGDDPSAGLDALLPRDDRRQALARVGATGRVHLAQHAALTRAIKTMKPDFAFLELNDEELLFSAAAQDLDLIDRNGALREAANALQAEAHDESRSSDDRDIAGAALARLYAYAQEIAR